MSKRVIFVDRDGTIIVEPAGDYQVDSLEKLSFRAGAISALRELTRCGAELVLATNQDGLGTASFPYETFRPAHDKMLETLRGEGVEFADQLIDRTFEHENAPTRKPRTGMFTRYMNGDYDLASSYVIGDRTTDIALARNLGAQGILLRPADEGRTMLEAEGLTDSCALCTDDWAEVADFILSDLDNAISFLQSIDEGATKVRINKEVAQLVKSRVALYEASFEKYHKGTGRVPGDADWPGYRVHPDYSLDVDAHVENLLTQAMEAAQAVADKVTLTSNSGVYDVADPQNVTAGWNPYYEMYTSYDLSGIDEVLMWRAYGSVGTSNITHGVSAYAVTGGANGLLKGYVESFLMGNGLPIYAEGSGYKGDETLDNVKADRDGRLQLFMFGESNWLPWNDHVSSNYTFLPVLCPSRQGEMGDMTGYRVRKGASFNVADNTYGKAEGTTGQILFRGVEAYLNYIEAQYMRDGSLDAKSDTYWRTIRQRAKVDEDYNKTIAATDMTKEAPGDWGAYSAGNLVDETLYNIRRERRCEFIGEGMRWNDLVRWCAMDQLKGTYYIPEGCNFWTSMYETAVYNEDHGDVTFIEYPAEGANISSREESVYIRPYRNSANNPGFNGYTWMEAHYNSPLPIREIQLLSETESVDNSVLYQTWGWPETAGLPAEQ